MRYFYIPVKDCSIYSNFPWLNSGADQILDVGKSSDGNFLMRSLLQFNIPSISASISNGTLPANTNFDLVLYIARADDMEYLQQVNVYPLSQSFNEGSGYRYQHPITAIADDALTTPTSGFVETNGATWLSRSSGSLWHATGSDYIANTVISQSLADPVTDLTINVTGIVQSWISGSISDGFLLKFPDADEQNPAVTGEIRFFSRQTHTIYSPQLVAKFDSQVYMTGSLSGSNVTNVNVLPRNLIPKYPPNQLVRVDLSVRDKYPQRTFDNVLNLYAGNQYLPQTSYYSIVDQQSNTVIVPFDNNSKVSCDGINTYITFRTDGLYAGRFYKIVVKVMDITGYETVHDGGQVFGVSII